MLIGYVSDERYVAIADCMLLFENESGATQVRSAANGAVYADIPPGRYRVALNKAGFGPTQLAQREARGSPHLRARKKDCVS